MRNFILLFILLLNFNVNAQPLKDLVTDKTKEVLRRFEAGEIEQVELPIYIYERLKKLETNTELNSLFFDGIAPYKIFKDNNNNKYYLFYKYGITFEYYKNVLYLDEFVGDELGKMFLRIDFTDAKNYQTFLSIRKGAYIAILTMYNNTILANEKYRVNQ